MSLPVRNLIDFATGDNWEMPPHLYDEYWRICEQLELSLPTSMTCIQYWLSTLPTSDRALIHKIK